MTSPSRRGVLRGLKASTAMSQIRFVKSGDSCEWFADGVKVGEGSTFTILAAHQGKRITVGGMMSATRFGSWRPDV